MRLIFATATASVLEWSIQWIVPTRARDQARPESLWWWLSLGHGVCLRI